MRRDAGLRSERVGEGADGALCMLAVVLARRRSTGPWEGTTDCEATTDTWEATIGGFGTGRWCSPVGKLAKADGIENDVVRVHCLDTKSNLLIMYSGRDRGMKLVTTVFFRRDLGDLSADCCRANFQT